MAKSERRNITFELPAEVYKALKEDAEVHGVESIHKRARDIIVDYLSNRELVELRQYIAALDADIAYQGRMLQRLAYSNIVHAAGRKSEEANEWIREHMPLNPNR